MQKVTKCFFVFVISLIFSFTGYAKVKLTFWDMMWGPAEYADAGAAIVERFNNSQDEIEVEYVPKSWSNWYQLWMTALSTDSLPNVGSGPAYLPFQFAEHGVLAPLDDLIEKWKKDGFYYAFWPNLLENLTYEGKTVALPNGLDMRIFFYNKDIFDKYNLKTPKNFKDFFSICKKLKKHNIYVYGDQGQWMHGVMTLMMHNGAAMWKVENGKIRSDMNSNKALNAAKFVNKLIKDGCMYPGGAGMEGADVKRIFAQGKIAITQQSPFFEKQLPKMNIHVLPYFFGPDSNGKRQAMGYINPYVIYKSAGNVKESKIFLNWWMKNMGGLWYDGHQTQVPPTKMIADHKYFKSNNSDILFKEYVPYLTPNFRNAEGAFKELNEWEGEGGIQNMQQSILQGKDPKLALDRVTKFSNNLFN